MASEREQRFALDLLLALCARGYDLERAFAAADASDHALVLRVAPAILATHPSGVPEKYRRLVADAVSVTVSAEPLHALLRKTENRLAILHHKVAYPGGLGAWPIWHENLDEVTVAKVMKRMVVFPEMRAEALALLVKGGARVAKLTEAVRLDLNAPYAAQVLASIRAAFA